MPIIYKIVPDRKAAYIKAIGEVTVEDILLEGAKMFAQSEWENGFSILCDYREVTEFNIDTKQVRMIVEQDMKHDPMLDKSKCAVVATDDLVYGMSRMWEILSADTRLTTEVFRDINDAINWLELDLDIFDSIKGPPFKAVNGDYSK